MADGHAFHTGDWLVMATISSTSSIIASGYLVHCTRVYMQMIEILDLVWILPIWLCTTLIFEFGEGVIVPRYSWEY